MSGYSTRDDRLRELMDDPDCDPVRLRRTLERFRMINRLVSGWGAVYRSRIRPRARAHRTLSILDIGCGGGDVLGRLVALARRDGIAVRGLGIDPDERALAVARRREGSGLTFRRAFAHELVANGERFDVVLSNHVLHHLDEPALAGFLRDSADLARGPAGGIVLHSDIARSRPAAVAYAVGITPLAPGSFLRTDGLRSIRRSWTPSELTARLPDGWRVERPAAFRLLAVHESPA